MTGIAADVQGFEETVAAVLGVLGKIVDYDLAVGAHARRPDDVPDRGARDLARAVRRVLRRPSPTPPRR